MVLTTSSTIALYLSVFLSCVSFAIIMPSVWPYLSILNSSKSFLAWVVASYSIGEAVGALFLGCLTGPLSTRASMVVATAVGATGSILYMLAGQFSEGGFGLWLIFLGRFAQGMWTGGAQAIQTVYLASILPVADLTPIIVTLRAYASLGFILGPVFGLALNFIPLSRESRLAAPGCFVLVSAMCTGVLFLTIFDEEGDRSSLAEDPIFPPLSTEVIVSTEKDPLLPGIRKKNAIGDVEQKDGHDLSKALLLCNLIMFALFSGFVVQETITTPIVESYYNWTVSSANLLFLGAGVCSLISFVAVRLLSRVFADREMLAWSLLLGVVGCTMLVSTPSKPLPAFRFLVGFFSISVAFPVGRGTTMALYTKILPKEFQGAGQGIILAVGAVARIFGPFWAVCALTNKLGALLVFGFAASLFAVCLCLVVIHYPRLKAQSGYTFTEDAPEG